MKTIYLIVEGRVGVSREGVPLTERLRPALRGVELDSDDSDSIYRCPDLALLSST